MRPLRIIFVSPIRPAHIQPESRYPLAKNLQILLTGIYLTRFNFAIAI